MKTRDVQDDGVVSDVRAARRAIAARFGYDLDRLFAFLREQEKARPARTGTPRRKAEEAKR